MLTRLRTASGTNCERDFGDFKVVEVWEDYLNQGPCARDYPGVVVDEAVTEERQVVDILPIRKDLDVHGRQDIRVACHGGLFGGWDEGGKRVWMRHRCQTMNFRISSQLWCEGSAPFSLLLCAADSYVPALPTPIATSWCSIIRYNAADRARRSTLTS